MPSLLIRCHLLCPLVSGHWLCWPWRGGHGTCPGVIGDGRVPPQSAASLNTQGLAQAAPTSPRRLAQAPDVPCSPSGWPDPALLPETLWQVDEVTGRGHRDWLRAPWP